MTLGDIKIQALKIMFATYDAITASSLADYYNDENYGPYLQNMNGSINRCLKDIEIKKVLEPLSLTITTTNERGKRSFNLSTLDNFYDIKQINLFGDTFYLENIPYKRTGNKIYLPDYVGSYEIEYYPAIDMITSSNTDDYAFTLPGNIVSLIPYFIKGELYREDEPNEASEAMNWYEQKLNQIIAYKTQGIAQAVVEETYKL